MGPSQLFLCSPIKTTLNTHSSSKPLLRFHSCLLQPWPSAPVHKIKICSQRNPSMPSLWWHQCLWISAGPRITWGAPSPWFVLRFTSSEPNLRSLHGDRFWWWPIHQIWGKLTYSRGLKLQSLCQIQHLPVFVRPACQLHLLTFLKS